MNGVVVQVYFSGNLWVFFVQFSMVEMNDDGQLLCTLCIYRQRLSHCCITSARASFGNYSLTFTHTKKNETAIRDVFIMYFVCMHRIAISFQHTANDRLECRCYDRWLTAREQMKTVNSKEQISEVLKIILIFKL